MKTTELRTVGRYFFRRNWGEGSVGAVFEGTEIDPQRPYAISRMFAVKRIHPEVAAIPSLAERIRVHAINPPRLDHPNIHPLKSIVCEAGQFLFIMDPVQGFSLDRCQGGSDKVVPEFLRVLDAFEYAHRRGFVHADIKPSNIVILPDCSIRIMDFQISRILGVTPSTAELLGCPEYASPEQATGDGTDACSDVYSLGIVLCKLLTGSTVCDQAPARFRDLIARAAHPLRNKRFASVTEFRAALETLSPRLVVSAGAAMAWVGTPLDPQSQSHQDLFAPPLLPAAPKEGGKLARLVWRPAWGWAATLLSGLTTLMMPSATARQGNGRRITAGGSLRPANQNQVRRQITASSSPQPLSASEPKPLVAIDVPRAPKRLLASFAISASEDAQPRRRVSASTQRARLLKAEPPAYPTVARKMRLSGTVRLEAMIATDGRVESVRALSGPTLLAEAAVGAVRNWLYKPAMENSKPVPVSAEIEINFAPHY